MLDRWVLLTIGAGLASVCFNYTNRYVLKDDKDSSAYSWWFEFFRFVIFFPIVIVTSSFQLSYSNLGLFLLIGITEFLAVYYYMKMHSFTELSVSTTIIQLRLIWIPLLAFIFLSEKLEYSEYLGIILIFAGQIATMWNSKHIQRKGINYALVSSVFTSFNNIVFKISAGVFSPQLNMVAMSLPSLFIFPYKMKDSKKRIIGFGRRFWKKILFGSTFNALSMYLLILALKTGPVGKVSGIFQSVMMLQVVAGILILNEKDNIGRKILGISFVLLGMLFLI